MYTIVSLFIANQFGRAEKRRSSSKQGNTNMMAQWYDTKVHDWQVEAQGHQDLYKRRK